MKYCDTDRSPDLTLGKLIALKVCVTQPAKPIEDGARESPSIEGTTSSHRFVAGRSDYNNSPTHNTAQFSNTTALLGAAGKISITCYWRQPAICGISLTLSPTKTQYLYKLPK